MVLEASFLPLFLRIFFPICLASCFFGRGGGSYDDRRFLDDRFSRDGVYPRGAYHRDILEGEHYPHPPIAVGHWPQTRRRSYEEDYPVERDSRRHEKPYVDSYHEIREADKYHEINTFRDGYRSFDSYPDAGFDRPSRYGGREHDDPYDDYDYKHRMAHTNREDSRERDYEYSRYSYDSDYERGSRRDGNWRRRESRERERDKGSSRERDPSPYRRHERSRSRSRGHDDRLRSRSPRSRSHSRSHREDSYDDIRCDRSERRRERDDKRYHDNYSVVCFLFPMLHFPFAFMFGGCHGFCYFNVGSFSDCCCQRPFTENY